jgi:hypothetical protein
MQALRDGVSRIIAFLPDLIAGLVVLAIGWAIAVGVSGAVRRLLPRTGFDRFLARHELMSRAPESTGSRAVGTGAAWVIFLIALMEATKIWRLDFVAAGLARVIAYVPNIVAAVLIFAAAWIAGIWVGDRLRAKPAEGESAAERPRANMIILPAAVQAGIVTIGAFVALRELLIAPEILVIGFTLVFGAIAVATGLAFGLGGRRAAEKMTVDWYESEQARRRREAERPGVH